MSGGGRQKGQGLEGCGRGEREEGVMAAREEEGEGVRSKG